MRLSIAELENFIKIKSEKLWNDMELEGEDEIMANDLLDSAMILIRYQDRLIKLLEKS